MLGVEEEGEEGRPFQLPDESPEFLLLRPLSVRLMKNLTEETLEDLEKGLSLLDPNPPVHLGQFVILPLLVHLKRFSQYRNKLQTRLLIVLQDALKKFTIPVWPPFVELFQRLHLVLGQATDPTKLNSQLPDDQMEACVNAISALCGNSLEANFHTLFGEKVQVLAHSIVMLLQVAEFGGPKSARLTALRVIQSYIQLCSGKQEESKRIFQMIPGIISKLKRLVDIRVGNYYKDLVKESMTLIQTAIVVTTEFLDTEALFQADNNLTILLTEIGQQFVSCDEFEMREFFLDWTTNYLERTAKKLTGCRNTLVSNLAILKADSSTEIAEKASIIFSRYSSFVIADNARILELFQAALSQLEGNNIKECSLTLAKISTLLQLSKLHQFELEEVMEAVFTIVWKNFEKDQNKRFSVLGSSIRPNDNSVKGMCAKVGESLVTSQNGFDILELCENKMMSFVSAERCDNFIGCILFLNNLFHWQAQAAGQLEVISSNQTLQFSELYIQCLEVQSTEVVLRVLETEAPKIQTLADERRSALIEGLSRMAKLHPTDLLPVVLYQLVEFAGSTSDSGSDSRVSLRALEELAKPLELREFLSIQMSGLLCDLSIRISNLFLYPSSPNALMFLATFFDFSRGSLMSLVEDAFHRSCDPFNGDNMQLLYARVFQAFLDSIFLHCDKSHLCNENSKRDNQLQTSPQNFYEFIKQHQERLGLNLDDEDDSQTTDFSSENFENSSNNTTNEQDVSVPEPPKQLPPELDLAKKICYRVLNFLPHADRHVKLVSMECLIRGFQILKEEEDAVLPLSHITWQNLVPRILEKDFVVVRKSFELLVCLSSTCGSFLRKRMLEEVFPHLSRLLSKLAVESENSRDEIRNYETFTQSFKLQVTVLQGLVDVCQAIEIQEEDLHRVVDGCLIYLKPKQHPKLREEAEKLINALANSSPKHRSIWMKLVASGMKSPPSSVPHPSFTPLPQRFTPKS